MAEPLPHDSDREPGEDEGMPRWVKVFVVVGAVLLVLLVVLLVAKGEHGPGRHLSASGERAPDVPPVLGAAR